MCHAGNICALCSPGITLFAEVMYLDTPVPENLQVTSNVRSEKKGITHLVLTNANDCLIISLLSWKILIKLFFKVICQGDLKIFCEYAVSDKSKNPSKPTSSFPKSCLIPKAFGMDMERVGYVFSPIQ